MTSSASSVGDFMATMLAPSRPMTLEAAVALAHEHYGIEARALRLSGERDENFKLTARDGAQFVLKIANPAEPPAVTELAIAALLHLETSDPTLPCPRVVHTLAGGAHVRFTDAGGTGRMARLLTYLPGKLLGTTTRSPLQRAACGRMGGRLSRALRGFEHPAAQRAIIWDVRHTQHMGELLEQLPRFPFRPLTLALLARLAPVIEARLPPLRHQVVHNDLNPLNVLVEPADETRVSGIIDFGDLTHTALIADVAVAAAEMIPQDCAQVAPARECVRDVVMAYHECCPLLPRELAALDALVAARLLLNVVVHEWHVHHNPSSDHFAALDAQFMRTRFAIADQLIGEELGP